jgi:plastocyanin
MKGARALASGVLVLGLCCAIPAISAAQDAATTTTSNATETTPAEPAEPGAAPVTPPTPADAPPEGTSAGGLSSSNGESAVRNSPGSSSPGVPAAAPSAVASAAPKARKSASASVTMGDFFFSPTSVSVAVGDTVTWRNNGQAPHNAVADDGSFKTPDLNNGQSASHTFRQAGSFSYLCTIHPQMTGTVRVLSSGGSGGGGGGGGDAAGSASSGSAPSEASAVASPDAAGDANTLPMTGMAAGGLALVGFALLALGLIIRQADPERSRRRRLPIF